MNRPALALTLLLALPATAEKLEILSISPLSGTVGGGDLVAITVSYEAPGGVICDPFPCDRFPQVTFGGVEAAGAEKFGDTILVLTPPHARGTASVTVQILDLVATAPAAFQYRDAQDLPPLSNYEAVLVPVAVAGPPLPGANGSLWTSELWASNRGPNRVELFHGMPRCAADCSGKAYPALEAGETRKLDVPVDAARAAYAFWLQKGRADDVTFSLRIRDVSRTDDNHGTEIPVARESRDFLSQKLTLLNVPFDGRSRVALRVYSFAYHVTEVPVRVTITSLDGPEMAASKVIVLKNPAGDSGDGRFGYAQYAFIGDLRAELPLPDGNYRIDIDNAHDFLLFGLWSMASVTNNRTQLVTAIVPR